MDAITFIDTIVCHQTPNLQLVFHELVHVEQYRQLGVDGFAEKYVRGFLKRGSYEAIPLESHAYALENQFSSDQSNLFNVTISVRHMIDQERY